MKTLALWTILLAGGVALMLWSYFGLQGPQRQAADRAEAAAIRAASQPATSASAPSSRAAETSPASRTAAALAPRPAAPRMNDPLALLQDRLKEGRKIFGPETRVPAAAFHLYIAGMALFLLGGVPLLLRLFRFAAARVRFSWLRLPLEQMQRRPRLLLAVHAAFFAVVIIFSEVAYAVPDAQGFLLASIRQDALNSGNPLGIAAKAYGSRSIPRAAATTLAVNFPLGSVATITLPSAILPGSGTIVVAVRSAIWGLILSPTDAKFSKVMLPHTLTLLLEGEGYVLATFFALLIPIFMASRSEGPTFWQRYGRALILNLQGNLLVLIVLAIAAIYEACEGIAMLPSPT